MPEWARSVHTPLLILMWKRPDFRHGLATGSVKSRPVIEEALQNKKRLFIRYLDRKGEVSERWITPKQILALNDYLYMVAHCHLRDDERNFRLDRIEGMEIENQSSNQRGKNTRSRNA